MRRLRPLLWPRRPSGFRLDDLFECPLKRFLPCRAFIGSYLARHVDEALRLLGIVGGRFGVAGHGVIGANTGMLRQWPRRGCQVPIATAIADAARPIA